jgi:hypothetical protein
MARELNSAPPASSRGFGSTFIEASFMPSIEGKRATGKLKANHLRGKIFKKTSNKLIPDSNLIRDYENFLSDSYAKVLKKELNIRIRYASGTHKGVGFATGKLQKSIKGLATVKTKHDRAKGRYNISYVIGSEFEPYGDFLDDGRRPAGVAFTVIRRWIRQKDKNNTFRINISASEKGDGVSKVKSKEKKLDGIAYAIQKKFRLEGRGTVLKNWYDYDKNKRLRRNYEREIKVKGAKYRASIRRSILRNIN